MPRVEQSGGASVRVQGIYAVLLERERELNAQDDRLAAEMMRQQGYCFHRERALFELLEAGRPVVIRRAAVEAALWFRDQPPRSVQLPFDRGSTRFVLVSADDRIAPRAGLEWDGAIASRSVRGDYFS